MSTEGATIRLATPTDVDDVDGLMALESRYYVDNLDPSRRAEGFISVLHSRDWFEDTIADGGLHVAIIDDAVAGFIGMTAPPRQAPGLPAVVSAMVNQPRRDRRVQWRADRRAALCHPGTGVHRRTRTRTRHLLRVQRRHRKGLPGPLRPRMLFVSAENPRSLHTTTTKLGATPLADFQADGHNYHFLAFPFRSE